MQDPTTFQQVKPHFPEQEQLPCPRCESTNTKFCYYNNYNLSQPRHFCKNCRRYWTKGGALRNIPVGGGSRKNAKRSSSSKRPNANSDQDTTKNHGPVPNQTLRMLEPTSAAVAATATSTQPVSISGTGSSGPVQDPTRVYGLMDDHERKVLDIPGSFSSLLSSNGQFGSLLEGLNPNGSDFKMIQTGDFGDGMNPGSRYANSNPGQNPGPGSQGGNGTSEGFMVLQSGDSSCWGGGNNGWPDLAIYTPGTSFH